MVTARPALLPSRSSLETGLGLHAETATETISESNDRDQPSKPEGAL